MAKVYWLHLYDHYDPGKEGYVGVSTKHEKRIQRHFRELHEGKHENVHLTHAYLRYGRKIISSVLFEGTEEECYAKELELRPLDQIGWNIVKGGSKPPSMQGKKRPEHAILMRGNSFAKGKRGPMPPEEKERRRQGNLNYWKGRVRIPWNKGKKGVQVAWNKGLTKYLVAANAKGR